MPESHEATESSEKSNLVLFQHKLDGRLNTAGMALDTIGIYENEGKFHPSILNFIKKEHMPTIDAAKYLFREFIEAVIVQGTYCPPPSEYPIEKLKEAYQKSDFDWQDKTQFDTFNNWFSGRT